MLGVRKTLGRDDEDLHLHPESRAFGFVIQRIDLEEGSCLIGIARQDKWTDRQQVVEEHVLSCSRQGVEGVSHGQERGLRIICGSI